MKILSFSQAMLKNRRGKYDKSGLLKDCDVYKAGHHGSNTSSSDELLDVIKPEYAVIMCGVNNSTVTLGWMVRLNVSQNIQVRTIFIITDLLGTIVFKSDGETLPSLPKR